MKPATERQKARMRELGIEFDDNLDMDEAAEILRDHLPPSEIKLNLTEHALVELSERKIGE
jgi:DUF971 family protein